MEANVRDATPEWTEEMVAKARVKLDMLRRRLERFHLRASAASDLAVVRRPGSAKKGPSSVQRPGTAGPPRGGGCLWDGVDKSKQRPGTATPQRPSTISYDHLGPSPMITSTFSYDYFGPRSASAAKARSEIAGLYKTLLSPPTVTLSYIHPPFPPSASFSPSEEAQRVISFTTSGQTSDQTRSCSVLAEAGDTESNEAGGGEELFPPSSARGGRESASSPMNDDQTSEGRESWASVQLLEPRPPAQPRARMARPSRPVPDHPTGAAARGAASPHGQTAGLAHSPEVH